MNQYKSLLLLGLVLALVSEGCSSGRNGGGSAAASASSSSAPSTPAAETYSVDVTASGISGGNLVLQNNSGNDLTIAANGSVSFSTELADGASYAVTVKDVPIGQTCAVTAGGSGTISGANVSVTAVCANTSVAALYSANGSKWNDYVQNDGNAGAGVGVGRAVFAANGDACTGSSENLAKGYYECIHGGEFRKVALTGRTSCATVTAVDDLGAFLWTCYDGTDPTTNPAVAVSYRLKDDKKLGDLIDNSPAWRSNHVTVYDGSNVIARTSPSTTWWSNSVSTFSGSANVASTIYVVSENTNNFDVNASKVGIVIRDDYTVSAASSFGI